MNGRRKKHAVRRKRLGKLNDGRQRRIDKSPHSERNIEGSLKNNSRKLQDDSGKNVKDSRQKCGGGKKQKHNPMDITNIIQTQ